MPVEKNEKVSKKETPLMDLKVATDNHTHKGKPVKKGASIKVTPEVKEMLEAAWAK